MELDQPSFLSNSRLNLMEKKPTDLGLLVRTFPFTYESSSSIAAPSNAFTATSSYSSMVDEMRRKTTLPSSMTAATLIANEEPPQIASSFLEATERLLKQGSQYQQKHEDSSRRLAGTFVALGSEQHPESVKDFLEKKRREARNALIESEESVRFQAKRREGYLMPDIEWEKFKENAVSQYLGAGSGGMLALLRAQKQRCLDATGSQAGFGDRQLSKEELLFAQTLHECNEEIISTHGSISNLPERFSNILNSSSDKPTQALWKAFVAVVTHLDGDARGMSSQDQVTVFRLSESFQQHVITTARSHLELSAFAAAEEQLRNPVRDRNEAPAGEGSNAVVSYTRSQLSKTRLTMESSGTRLHGLPVWALIYYAVRMGALKTAVNFCGQGDEATRVFSRYLTEYHRNNGALLATSLMELQTLYRNLIAAGHPDLYKRAVMAIVARAEPEQDFGGITHSVSDWLWMKLAQTEVSSCSSSDMTLLKLQQIVRSRFPAKQTDDGEAVLAFLLTGQFEVAVERLFLNLKFRVSSVCMAIALKQAKLLLISYQPQTASVVTERAPLFFLDFASVVRIYVDGFRKKHVDLALDFFFHLSDTPAVKASTYDHSFENLFQFCLYKLAKDTGFYSQLFGQTAGSGQMPRKGLVSRLMPDSSRVTVAVAQDLLQNGDLVDGLALYDIAKETTLLFKILLKALADDLIFPTTLGHRKNLQSLATGYVERYQVSGNEEDLVLRNLYVILDLVTFLGLVDSQEFRQALAVMKDISLIPLEQNLIATALAAHQNDLLPEVRDCVPFISLQTMHALVNCYTAEKERILACRLGAEVGAPLRTANLLVSGGRLSDELVKLQTVYRKQSRAILDFANKIPSAQLPNLMDLLIKLEASIS